MTIGLRSALSAGKRMTSKEKPLSDVRSTPIRMATDGATGSTEAAAIPIAVHSALLSHPTIQFENWRELGMRGTSGEWRDAAGEANGQRELASISADASLSLRRDRVADLVQSAAHRAITSWLAGVGMTLLGVEADQRGLRVVGPTAVAGSFASRG